MELKEFFASAYIVDAIDYFKPVPERAWYYIYLPETWLGYSFLFVTVVLSLIYYFWPEDEPRFTIKMHHRHVLSDEEVLGVGMHPLKGDEFDPGLLIEEIKEKEVNGLLDYRSSFVEGDYQQEELNSYLTEKLDNDMITVAIILADDPNPQMEFGVIRPEVTKSVLDLAKYLPSTNGPLMETLVYLFMQLKTIVRSQIKTVYKYITEHLLIQLRLPKFIKSILHILYSERAKKINNARMELRLMSQRIRASETDNCSDWPTSVAELRAKHGYERLVALYDEYLCNVLLPNGKKHREVITLIKHQKRLKQKQDESDENLKEKAEEALALEPQPMDDPESMNKPNLVEKHELLEHQLFKLGFKLMRGLESSEESDTLYDSDTTEYYGSGKDSDSVKSRSSDGSKSVGIKSLAHEALKEHCLVEDLDFFEEYEALEEPETMKTKSLEEMATVETMAKELEEMEAISEELYETESETEEYDTMGESSSSETESAHDNDSRVLEVVYQCKMMSTDSEELNSVDLSLSRGSGSSKNRKEIKSKSLPELKAKDSLESVGTKSLKEFEIAGTPRSMRNKSLEELESKDKSEKIKKLKLEEWYVTYESQMLLEELKSRVSVARSYILAGDSSNEEPESHLPNDPEGVLGKILLGTPLSYAELKEIARGSLDAYFEKMIKGNSITPEEKKRWKLLQFMASPLMQEDHTVEDQLYLLRESYEEMDLSEHSDDDQDSETEINSEARLKSFVPVSEYSGSSTELLSISDFEDDGLTPSDIVVNTDSEVIQPDELKRFTSFFVFPE